ncbi:MAG: ATP-binding protein [Thermodesulfobacteriota bacterium]|nr:ATP-binding protein [Thermodesulfobacteriota bacterium]
MVDSQYNRNRPLKLNLLVFAVLFALVLGYFYWQIAQSRRAFDEHVSEHARLVSEVVAANLRNASQSRQVVEQIVTSFLANTARFVAYLDAVEPFSADELVAYAQENGLSSLWIQHATQPAVMAPPKWFNLTASQRSNHQQQLLHIEHQHLYVLIWPSPDSERTIVLGIHAQAIEQLQQKLGVPQLLKALSQLTGIAQLRLEPAVALDASKNLGANERHLPVGDNTLVLVVEPDSLSQRIALLWREFFLFSALLAIAGLLLSWFLYRYQNRHINHLWQLQHQLALQREDASLGRGAAAISHEIRNPLNAISMGLQRLQLEASALDADHRQLIEAMCAAVQRTNGIVTGLQRYALPLKPQCQAVNVEQQINKVVALYRPQAEQQRVSFACMVESLICEIDEELFGQLLENLLKNALEAQQGGGFVRLVLHREDNNLLLIVENGLGDTGDTVKLDQCLEPYYTTKTRGTGLGLTMVRKIAVAHGGEVMLDLPEANCFRVRVRFPMKGAS